MSPYIYLFIFAYPYIYLFIFAYVSARTSSFLGVEYLDTIITMALQCLLLML